MIRPVSCHDVSALLALVGLGAELGAVAAILWPVGLGDWVKKQAGLARTQVRRVGNYARRLWPWSKQPERVAVQVPAGGALAGGGTVTARAEVGGTGRLSPRSFEEVDQRLNEIAAELTRLERETGERTERLAATLREEIGQARAESARRQDELDALIEAETRKRFAEKKLEGGIFGLGIGLQLAGAGVLLFVC